MPKKIIFFISVFNPDIIGNSTDLYVVRSLDYKHCDYEDDQSNMAQPPSPAQLVII